MISLYVCHKKKLANEITGNFTCIVSTWGTLRHRYSAGRRSHWIEHTEPGFSNFAVLRFVSKLSFCISNSILHHAVIYQASWVSTKGSNWILQLGLSVCRLFWFLSVHFWLPCMSRVSRKCCRLRGNLDYIVTLELSEFCNDWFMTLSWESLCVCGQLNRQRF